MNRKGILYDVGRVLGVNWHPHFDPKMIHRELLIIKHDLHCTTVKICGLDIAQLMIAAEEALALSLEVWLSPEMWNKPQKQTLAYLVKAATAAESLRERWSEQVIFSVGTEATFFIKASFWEERTRNEFTTRHCGNRSHLESPIRCSMPFCGPRMRR